MILVFWMLSFKPTFSLSSFTFIKRLFSSSLSAMTAVSSAYLLLLLLSHCSRVRLCVTPQTAAHQAPPTLGFSRQEHWSGLPFPSPMRESEVAQSCPTLSDPMDRSPPGSSIHGIFQARVLEWGALPSLPCSLPVTPISLRGIISISSKLLSCHPPVEH